ncbi:hypothetical protein [Paenibacillus crassostreae]|uniref:Uncharacterized protein n=1 Tax=Paenibacillus crassostreae TaxID=1763538 RepID=A0A167DM50_9BACL|nr:hypothetical protein [Paenibacillus crassostreae]AOZ91291.1 hypothetical protein LPB68_03120 [Paenibacillus crassostreae]OAB74550.1 hypothetical protein PNBC_10840 [Paenibacillus crassostreae]
MNHLSIDDKKRLAQSYIDGTCTKEQERTWEAFLIDDSEAIDLHIQLLSSMELRMPILTDSVQFTNDVMSKLPTQLYESDMNSFEHKRRWYELPIFHYTVAACITILFMTTGMFDMLIPGKLDVIEQRQSQPVSDQMMDMTITWLDQLKR